MSSEDTKIEMPPFEMFCMQVIRELVRKLK